MFDHYFHEEAIELIVASIYCSNNTNIPHHFLTSWMKFIELLSKTDSKINEVEKVISKKQKKKLLNNNGEEPNWSVLSDSYMLGKGWDDDSDDKELEKEYE